MNLSVLWSAPVIWILLPLAAGAGLWLLRSRIGRMVVFATLFCLGLALAAWVLPFGQPVRIGPVAFTIDTTLAFAGRRLVLDGDDRSLLVFLYLLCAFWFAGSYAAGPSLLLAPFGLGVAALLVAALAVDPFLYAALLVETAVLVSVPLLAPPGSRVGQGVLRFLIFQTLAMPFILLAGWALGGVEANPSSLTLVTLSSIFLGLGFAFWLAVFPFYTWVPLLAEQTRPYVVGFIFLIFPTVQLLLGLNFLDRFGWLRAAPEIFGVIRLAGTLMVVTAGFWAVFQRDLSRLFGYAVIVETGFSLLAVGLVESAGKQLFSAMFLPRVIGFGLWALSLSILLREARSARFDDVRGLAQKLPFAAAGLAVAWLTLGGLPLLPVFPIHQVLLEELARTSFWNAVLVLAGSGGMLFSAFRALAVLAQGSLTTQKNDAQVSLLPREFTESRLQIGLIAAGVIGLLLIGLFPQVFLPVLNGLSTRYLLLP